MSIGDKGGFMRSRSRASVALAAVLALAAVGCGKVGELKAKKAMKNANQAYQAQDYKKAASLYEEAIDAAPDSEDAHIAHFYLANSLDQLWKPSRKGEAENDALLQKAVEHYQKAAETLANAPDDQAKKLAKLSLQYLVAAYGVDKLNDPGKAEPIVLRMIQMDPGDTANYFQLAKLYEDAGVYDQAEQMYLRAKEAKPKAPEVYGMLAGYYNRQGEFDKTIASFEQAAAVDPNNPEWYFKIASYDWDDAQRNFKLTDAQKREHVMNGLTAVDKALAMKPDYIDALIYKGLLLRLQALQEKDPGKQQALIKEAVTLHDKAVELQKKKAAGEAK
jgi:tetratricopeptide (TPR) repeat protein